MMSKGAHALNRLRPIVIACAVFALGASFMWGYQQGQRQANMDIEPMTQELQDLQSLLAQQQRERQQQLIDLQNRIAQQQQQTTRSSSVLSELEHALLGLNAEYSELLSAYRQLEAQFNEREALIRQWLAQPAPPHR